MKCVIGEINVICTDLERSLAFYRDALDFIPLEAEGPGISQDIPIPGEGSFVRAK